MFKNTTFSSLEPRIFGEVGRLSIKIGGHNGYLRVGE